MEKPMHSHLEHTGLFVIGAHRKLWW
jgi:hypothetical protein